MTNERPIVNSGSTLFQRVAVSNERLSDAIEAVPAIHFSREICEKQVYFEVAQPKYFSL